MTCKPLHLRRYGSSGPRVVLVHGGPGVPGYLAEVARELASDCRVEEPFQRGSGTEPLSVAQHVADLAEVVVAEAEAPCVIGHSWGAMLALAWAAEHPRRVGSLVLVGCGTFDDASRRRLHAERDARMDADLHRRLARVELEEPDEDSRLAAAGQLLLPLYSFDPLGPLERAGALEPARCDARAHHESWDDMLRCQQRGDYPAAFAAIEAPVLMLHGAADPHPGRMIRDCLSRQLAHLEYLEWQRCGHYPWLERAARETFFSTTRGWIARHHGSASR